MAYQKKIVISVSGTADMSPFGEESLRSAKDLGREIAKAGCVLATGATSGFPHYAAIGYQEAKGVFSLGLSPASDEKEHTELYLLPLEPCDIIIYTGFGFPMRDILMTKTGDAMVVGPGRIGTIHEFTVAYETNMPLGILEGPWKTDEVIRDIIRNSHRVNNNVIFDSDSKRLLDRLIEMVKEKKEKEKELGDVDITELKAKV